MTDTRRTLRTTADALARDLDALITLEDEKRSLPFDDPRLREISRQVEEIGQRVQERTAEQTDLADSVAAQGLPGSIDTTRRPVAEILREWRELERRSETVEPDSVEAAEVAALIRHIRAEYRLAADTVEPRHDQG